MPSASGLEIDRSVGVPKRLEPPEPRPNPEVAIDIRKSVFPGHLVCLEDRKTFKTLTRHLGETHWMTPEQYRGKWGLPANYPMIAPDYAKLRSELSKKIGLGRRR